MCIVLLSDVELLGLVVGENEAKQLYSGELSPLFAADERESSAHFMLAAARELVRRYLAEELYRDVVLVHPESATKYLRAHFAGLDREVFVGLFLDNQHRLIAIEELACGTLNEASIYPREVVKRVLHHRAAALVAAHNHPSGVAEPSWADRALTRRLKDALALLDVRVLDHFVVGGTKVVSFAERGWL